MAMSPRPPAPTAPAMAEAPIIDTTVMVKPATMLGRASGSSTCQMMCQRPQPMAWAASIRPLSTSFRPTSAMRAKKGVALIVSGTTAAQTPMVVPVTQRVKGIRATSRMMKGVARKPFTRLPSTRFSRGEASRAPGADSTRNTASGRPSNSARPADRPTMVRVSTRPCSRRSITTSEMAFNITQVLGLVAQMVLQHGLGPGAHAFDGQHQATMGVPLQLLDAAVQQARRALQHCGQTLPVGKQVGLAGVAQLDQAVKARWGGRHSARRGRGWLEAHALLQLRGQAMGQRRQQGAGGLVARCSKHLPDGPLLHGLALFQHQHLVADLSDHPRDGGGCRAA